VLGAKIRKGEKCLVLADLLVRCQPAVGLVIEKDDFCDRKDLISLKHIITFL